MRDRLQHHHPLTSANKAYRPERAPCHINVTLVRIQIPSAHPAAVTQFYLARKISQNTASCPFAQRPSAAHQWVRDVICSCTRYFKLTRHHRHKKLRYNERVPTNILVAGSICTAHFYSQLQTDGVKSCSCCTHRYCPQTNPTPSQTTSL